MEQSNLIIIIACGGLLLIIIIVSLYFCFRKKKANTETNQESKQHVEIHVQQDNSSKQKPFIKLNNTELIDNKSFHSFKENSIKDASNMMDKSNTERKLLDRNTKDETSDLGLGEEPKTNKNNDLDASFRVDLHKYDSNQDKIKDLIDGNMNINNKIDIDMEPKKLEDKTSKDIVTDNIHNYTEGNRGDFYSERDEDVDDEDDLDMEYYGNNHEENKYDQTDKTYSPYHEGGNGNEDLNNKMKSNGSNAKFSSKSRDNRKNSSDNFREMELDMSPDEFNDDEEEDHEYKNYMKNSNQPNRNVDIDVGYSQKKGYSFEKQQKMESNRKSQ